MQPNMNALIAKYQELHHAFRDIASAYFKGSTLTLAVYAACLGYLFTVPLTEFHARLACTSVITVGLFWYAGCFWLLHLHRTLTKEVVSVAEKLSLDVDMKMYLPIKALIYTGIGAFIPLMVIMLLLLASPPHPVTPAASSMRENVTTTDPR